MTTDTKNSKTLQVSNLAPEANDAMISSIFSPFGQIVQIRLTREGSGCKAEIDYSDHVQASIAITAMNNIKFLNRELRVSWVAPIVAPGSAGDTHQITLAAKAPASTERHYIYVGDLPEVADDKMLHDHFQQFGPVVEAKIVRNPDGSARGYGFVGFAYKNDADTAITKMDRSWWISKAIRVNWATRNPTTYANANLQSKSFDEVVNESSTTNTTVYCGGIMVGLTEELIKANFIQYGQILDIKIYEPKGFAFIKYADHESATRAIVEKHGARIGECYCKCSWGKENYGVGSSTSSVTSTVAPTSTFNPQMTDYYSQYYQQYYPQYYQYYQQYYQSYYNAQQQQGASAAPVLPAQQQQAYWMAQQNQSNNNNVDPYGQNDEEERPPGS